MDALSRAKDIERDFYYLRSVEWGISEDEARRMIEDKMRELSAQLEDWRKSGSN